MKVQKISLKRKEGRMEEKGACSGPVGPGLEPGTYHVLGDGPQQHATGVV